MKKYLLLITSLFLCSIFCKAQYGGQIVLSGVPATGYHSPTVQGLFWLPADYDESKTYPFIISFGGDGQTSIDALMNVKGCAWQITNNGWNGTAVNPNTGLTEEFIIWSPIIDSPQGTNKYWFNAPAVKSQLDYFESNYSINTNKVFITGLSAGGYATLTGMCDDITLIPRFAAAAPMSAVGDTRFDNELVRTVTYNLPVYFVAGGSGDPQYSTCLNYYNIINSNSPSIPAAFTVVAGGAHNNATWGVGYSPTTTHAEISNLTLYEWFLKNSRVGAPANTITTGTISGSPFCVTGSSGASLSVPFTSTGTFNSGNVYKAQLSTATGSFNGSTLIGTTTSTANSGTISCIIPPGTPGGTAYRIKVNSTDPLTIGTKNTSNIIINFAANSIAPIDDQNITVGANGPLLTVTEQTTPISRTWYYGTTLGTYNTSTGVTTISYTPNFGSAGTYYVVCKSVYSCKTAKSNPVTINVSPGFTGNTTQQKLQSAMLMVHTNARQITCRYSIPRKGEVVVTVYDEYGRPYANFNGNQTAGLYSHSFTQQFPDGVYLVVLQYNRQKISAQRVLIGN